ncbi:MAG TPA: heme-copper oxidase subunit III [Burkholderiales bacterium]|nr:heme-copper oxidase subunit III [Burkholderiales bacterium]
MPRNSVVSARAAAGAGEIAAHWETSPWPLVLSAGILLALPAAFTLHFVYHQTLAAALALGIGVPLVVASIVGWVNEALAGHGAELAAPAMGWFILAEALIFVSFFAAYWYVRLSAHQWPPAGSVPMPKLVPAVMTLLLVSSSLTCHAAEAALGRGARGKFIGWLALTAGLGTAFVALSAYEWRELMAAGFFVHTNVFGTAFYSLTGFHAAHVIVGLGIFAAMLGAAAGGRVNPTLVRAGGLYWHFVDIVWLFVVSQVYFW